MNKRSRKSDIPPGAQFSPAQTPLPDLLEILDAHRGDESALEAAIATRFFGHHSDPVESAKNTIRAVRLYGILDDHLELTPLGKGLVEAKDRPEELYRIFARHILLDRRGLEIVQTIIDMHVAKEEINLTTIRERLAERGIYMPPGGVHFSSLKNWLAMSGVFVGEYDVDEAKVSELIGVPLEDADALAAMPVELRAYLRALACLAPTGPVSSSKVAAYANRLYGVKYPEKTLPKMLEPLAREGFIRLIKTTGGRGAKPHVVETTAKFNSEYLKPLLESLERATGLQLRSLFAKPLDEILREVRDPSKHVKGKGLEALAIYLVRLLGLKFVGWRLRGQASGGAEVDVIVESDRFIFSRWQIQCKNTGSVRLDDVAKEVGLTFRLKSNVILVVSTGDFSKDAREYAESMMQSTNLQIILLGKKDLNQIMRDPISIIGILDREAKHAMDIKRIEV